MKVSTQEMSNEMEYMLKPPNVVARLMGLEGFPVQQSLSPVKKSLPEGHLQNAFIKQRSVPRHDVLLLEEHNNSKSCAQEQPQYKDMDKTWMQSTKTGVVEQQNGRYNENASEKEMAVVCHKFIEAKCLANNQKLHHSKEFQDAQAAVSSKRNLLLEFLKEPNPLFLKHFHELQSITTQTKRIALLKPSEQVKKHQLVELNEWKNNRPSRSSVSAHREADISSHPTRIVVLKPRPSKTNDNKTVVSSLAAPLSLPQGKAFYGEEEAKWQTQESLSSDQRDEVLLTSVLSNDYVGDESSFNKSKNERIREENLSDSEIVIPSSTHSWNYINRDGSPHSTSSLSCVSYSSESSISKEAKKRLSERWAMMTLTSISQEQQQAPRSSRTLCEMLEFPNVKDTVKSKEEGNNKGTNVCRSKSCGERGLGSCLSNNVDKDEHSKHSPTNLSRSRSIPLSSTTYEKARLIIKIPSLKLYNSLVSKKVSRPKTRKSSLKEKISNLFFFRNKKPSKEEPGPFYQVSSQVGSRTSSAQLMETLPEVKQLSVGQTSDDNLDGGTSCSLEGDSFNLGGPSYQICSPLSAGPDQGGCTSEASLYLVKTQQPENSSKNHDQRSPISILEVQFEDDVNAQDSSEIDNGDCHESSAHLCHKSESADRSPIGPITGTLSLDETASSASPTPFVVEPSTISSESEEEQEWFLFTRMLLSAAGLDQERSETVYHKWHSLDSPLDPALLKKYVDQKEGDQQLNEAKHRKWRSHYKLLFDCINEALMDMVRCRSLAIPLTTASSNWVNQSEPGTKEVWIQVREWFSGHAKWFCAETDARLLIESESRKQVAGRGWAEMMQLEVDGMGKEIEEKILEELVEEALADLEGELL